VDSLFNFVNICFVVQKHFNFMWYHLSILFLSCWAIYVLFKKSLPMHISSSVFHIFSFTSSEVSGIILRFLIHLELILAQGDRHWSSFRFLHTDIQFSRHICWRGCLFSTIHILHLFKKQMGTAG
jgi:hypothetical protein